MNGGSGKPTGSVRGVDKAAKVRQTGKTVKPAAKKAVKSDEQAKSVEASETSEADSNEASVVDSNASSVVDSAEASVADSKEENASDSLEESTQTPPITHVEPTVSVEISKVVDESSEIHDEEVAAVTHNESSLGAAQEHNESAASSSLSSSRPITPEVAQLRNRFESLHAESHSSSAPKDLRSNSPNRVKDMINRFTG